MKLHKPILIACENSLHSIFFENRHAEKVVDFNLKSQKKWGARDRRQYAEIVYDVVRWWRRLGVLSQVDSPTLDEPQEKIRKRLQVYFDWREEPSKYSDDLKKMTLAERESIPDELNTWCHAQVGEEWPKILEALNKPARQYLRVNLSKISRQELQKKLAAEDVLTEVIEIDSAGFTAPAALALKERKNVFITQAFKAGYFEMQDLGSQMISPFLHVEPGQRVVDACAGAGGKTLHIADIMGQKGSIIALDIHDWKLNELKTRARRAQVSQIETRIIDSTKTIKRLYDSADRLLLDVPCSAIGVLRRHPDTKWKLSPDEISTLLETQQDILLRYAPIVKVGGIMVYATCSLARAENEMQIEKFLTSSHGAFELEEQKTILPTEFNSDGFFMARMKRKK
jgi:16S rRNA (cytosine967-C5)-methyltransferase